MIARVRKRQLQGGEIRARYGDYGSRSASRAKQDRSFAARTGTASIRWPLTEVQRPDVAASSEGPVPDAADTRPAKASDSDQSVGVIDCGDKGW